MKILQALALSLLALLLGACAGAPVAPKPTDWAQQQAQLSAMMEDEQG